VRQNAELFERLTQQVVAPIEMARQERERCVRFGHRAARVAILRSAQESRGEPNLVLDDRVEVLSAEEKADHRVGHHLLVEPAKHAPDHLFATRVVPETHQKRTSIPACSRTMSPNVW
jgi:hypothetical protein